MKTIKILILTIILACGNLFANAVATITALKGEANIQRAGESILATLGAKLQEKDTIITKDNTKLQIIFKDDTIISIGKNSNFSIKEYMFEDNKEPVARFKMLKGAMRTITGRIGKIAPQKFSVATKTATIGIRGTNFTLLTGADGSYNAYCTFGKISATHNGKIHIIKQGYFISVSPAGKIQIKEFTPKDLKNMKRKNFGSKNKSKGNASKGEEPIASDNGEQIDTVTTDNSDVIINDISDQTSDAILAKSTSDKSVSYINWDGPTFNNTDGENSINEDIDLYFNTDSTELLSDGYSYIRISLLNTADENDNWWLNMASATSFTSKESFSTTLLATPELNTFQASTSTTNYVVSNSSVIATGDDLADGDYMTWGSWSAEITYDDSSNTGNSHALLGLWVAGQETSEAVVANLTGTATYEGVYRALNSENNPVNGTASMDIDFGADTATLDLSDIAIYDLTISGDYLSGGERERSGYAEGEFYGPNGNSVAGSFTSANGSMIDYKGVYQVTKSEQLP